MTGRFYKRSEELAEKYESLSIKDTTAKIIGRAIADTEFREVLLSKPQIAFKMMGVRITREEAKSITENSEVIKRALGQADDIFFRDLGGLEVAGLKVPTRKPAVNGNCGCG